MKCSYEVEVRAQCPVMPDDTDVYQFTIESESIVQVERIVEFIGANAGKKHIFQEDLTNKCAVALGARVTSVGWHSGVKVTCVAP